jgi:uncharacterized protein (DUF305 family)
MKTSVLIAALAGLIIANPAVSQQAPMSPSPATAGTKNMNMDRMGAAHKEFHAVMEKMNQAMMQGMMDPDPGMSWMKQMIAHHEAAVEMSDIVLKHTKNEDVRKEARKTKEENEKGLKQLQAKMKKEDKKG